eukprot:PhF_6_TR40497/c1_g1_i1/m.60596
MGCCNSSPTAMDHQARHQQPSTPNTTTNSQFGSSPNLIPEDANTDATESNNPNPLSQKRGGGGNQSSSAVFTDVTGNVSLDSSSTSNLNLSNRERPSPRTLDAMSPNSQKRFLPSNFDDYVSKQNAEFSSESPKKVSLPPTLPPHQKHVNISPPPIPLLPTNTNTSNNANNLVNSTTGVEIEGIHSPLTPGQCMVYTLSSSPKDGSGGAVGSDITTTSSKSTNLLSMSQSCNHCEKMLGFTAFRCKQCPTGFFLCEECVTEEVHDLAHEFEVVELFNRVSSSYESAGNVILSPTCVTCAITIEDNARYYQCSSCEGYRVCEDCILNESIVAHCQKTNHAFQEMNARPSSNVMSSTGSVPTNDNVLPVSSSSQRRASLVTETPTLHKSMSTNGNKLINQYAVIRNLGQGAFGKVKLAENSNTHKLFAIKIMNKKKLGKVTSHEVAIMKRLKHPNVVRLHEVIDDVESDKMYLILEYVKNGPVCPNFTNTPLSEEKVRRYARQIAEGLCYLHRMNTYHRDVKPDNILVSEDDVVKLTDFGVSCHQIMHEEIGQAGTPAFFSPEAFLNKPISLAEADAWAYGVTLYVMSHGTIPFAGRTFQDMQAAVIAGDLRFNHAAVSPVLIDLLQKLLHKDISQRIGLEDVFGHPFLSCAVDLAFLPIEISDIEEKNAVVIAHDVTLRFSSTIGAILRIKRLAARHRRGSTSSRGSLVGTDSFSKTPVVLNTPAPTPHNHSNGVTPQGFTLKLPAHATRGSVGTPCENALLPEWHRSANILGGDAESVVSMRSMDSSVSVQSPAGLRRTSSGYCKLMTEEEVALEDNTNEDALSLIRRIGEVEGSELILDYIHCSRMPTHVFQLTNLRVLSACMCSMVDMGDQYFMLKRLTRLVLSRNQLEVFPSSITELTSLEHLDVSRNKLTYIPREISNLTHLRYLNFEFNNIENIPKWILSMPQLTHLYLIENKILGDIPHPEEDAITPKRSALSLDVALDNTPTLIAQSKLPPYIHITWNKIFPDKVLDFLYLGSVRTVQSERVMRMLGISCIITCGSQLQILSPLPPGIDHHIIPLCDLETADVRVHFEHVLAVLEEMRLEGRNVIVHCFAGVSRSSSCVVAYIMAKMHKTFDEAMQFVKEHRPAANPNEGFRKQLMKFETEIQGRQDEYMASIRRIHIK